MGDIDYGMSKTAYMSATACVDQMTIAGVLSEAHKRLSNISDGMDALFGAGAAENATALRGIPSGPVGELRRVAEDINALAATIGQRLDRLQSELR